MNILVRLFGVIFVNYYEICYNCKNRLRLIAKFCSDRKHPYHLWHKKTCEKRHKDFVNLYFTPNKKVNENR